MAQSESQRIISLCSNQSKATVTVVEDSEVRIWRFRTKKEYARLTTVAGTIYSKQKNGALETSVFAGISSAAISSVPSDLKLICEHLAFCSVLYNLGSYCLELTLLFVKTNVRVDCDALDYIDGATPDWDGLLAIY